MAISICEKNIRFDTFLKNMTVFDIDLAQPFLYKDAAPEATIHRIREIFTRLGIFITEGGWNTNGKYLHSVRITYDDSFFSSNGKGMTQKAALASAYAELLERMQNQWYSQIYHNLVLNDMGCHDRADFTFAPDEIFLTPSEFINHVADEILMTYAPKDIEQPDPEKWVAPFAKEGKLLCVPFVDIISNEIIYFPLDLIRFQYGSTGMCAGNTPHEALVQGMSEVAERHAIDVLYHEKMTPPSIDRCVISDNPILLRMISDIEREREATLFLRDCSLGVNLPVVAAVMHDRKNGAYHIHMGAHPNMDEAISRSLTEIFQGRAISDSRGETTVNFNDKLFSKNLKHAPWSKNFLNLMKLSYGAYPKEFFFDTPGYQSRIVPPFKKYQTQDAYRFMCSVLHNVTNGPILIRDVSYLGFPGFQVIVPGMVSRRYTMTDLKLHIEKKQLGTSLLNLDQKNKDELIEIRNTIERVCKNEVTVENNIASFTYLPLKSSSQWAKISPLLLLVSLNIAAGSYEKAISNCQSFIDITKHRIDEKSELLRYFSILRDFLVLTGREKFSMDSVKNFLCKFYSKSLVEAVIQAYDGEKPFCDLMIPKCFDCKRCELADECNIKIWNSIYPRLRHEMKKSSVDQKELLKILNDPN